MHPTPLHPPLTLARVQRRAAPKSAGRDKGKIVRQLSEDFAAKVATTSAGHDEAAIRRRAAPATNRAPGLPADASTDPFPWPDEVCPKLITSYATKAAGGFGLDYTWALSNMYKTAGIPEFQGRMVMGAENWQEQWYGILGIPDGVEAAVVHLSVEYFRSEACVEELRAICKKFKSDRIIPVIVGEGFSMAKMQELVMQCDFLGKPFQRQKIAGLFHSKIDGNWFPTPDKGVFQDDWKANTQTLMRKIRALL